MKNLLFLTIILFISTFSYAQINLQDSLVAYFPFNGNANDESIHNNNGTVFGATLTTDRFGNSNSAYLFDGVNDEIRISSPFGGTNPFGNYMSIVGWLKTNTSKTSAAIVGVHSACINGATDDLLIAYINNTSGHNHLQTRAYYHNPIIQVDESSITDDNWHQFVYVFSETTAKLYLDGVAVDSSANIVPKNYIHQVGNDLVIGNLSPNSCPYDFYFEGVLDEIRLYNKALKRNEIQALYNEGNQLVGNSDVDCNIEIKVFPNPTSGIVKITSVFSGTKSFSIQVYNSIGQFFEEKVVLNAEGKLEEQLDLRRLAGGVYLIKINTS